MNRRRLSDTPAALLDHEFAQERASALGRLGRALEAALAALAAFDANHANSLAPAADIRAARGKIVAEASVALWQFVVQREACGLRDMRALIRDYRVPAEVAARMGAVLPEQPVRRRR
jgi:ribosomal 50S subunit-associated protein YjgA (DUF615 family)